MPTFLVYMLRAFQTASLCISQVIVALRPLPHMRKWAPNGRLQCLAPTEVEDLQVDGFNTHSVQARGLSKAVSSSATFVCSDLMTPTQGIYIIFRTQLFGLSVSPSILRS